MKYNEEDIEFASQILNHRADLDDEQVTRWMEDPVHVELLKEFTAIGEQCTGLNFEKYRAQEYARFERTIRGRKKRYLIRWAVAASVVLTIGVCIGWMTREMQFWGYEELSLHAGVVAPEQRAVELILDNGESVMLDGKGRHITGDRVSGIKDDSLQGLTYSQVRVDGNDGEKEIVYNTLRVPTGGFYQIELADGTRVWLNSESELRFPVQFADGTREVYLKGEAYFNVMRDEKKPFMVHLNGSNVTVLGTSFNIKAYGDEEDIYTTLVEGSVRFTVEKGQEQVVLRPGMQSVWNAMSGKTVVSKVDVEQFIAWKEGRFVFPSTTLEKLMIQLKRWYNIDVVYVVPEVKEYEFRGAINRDMDLNNVLSLIEKTSNVIFNVHGKTINVTVKN